MDFYLPGEDSRFIGEALKSLVKPGMLVLDMGTGSGYLGKLAKALGARVLAVDINPKAVKKAREEGLEARVSDLFSNVNGRFDLIVFNPPYLELSDIERKGEPIEYALDGGKEGLAILFRFLGEARNHLNPGGELVFIHFERNKNKIEEKLRNLGYKYRILGKRYISMEGWLVAYLAWL